MLFPAGRAGALRYWFSDLLLCIYPTNEIANRVSNCCIGLRRLRVRFLFYRSLMNHGLCASGLSATVNAFTRMSGTRVGSRVISTLPLLLSDITIEMNRS